MTEEDPDDDDDAPGLDDDDDEADADGAGLVDDDDGGTGLDDDVDDDGPVGPGFLAPPEPGADGPGFCCVGLAGPPTLTFFSIKGPLLSTMRCLAFFSFAPFRISPSTFSLPGCGLGRAAAIGGGGGGGGILMLILC